MKKSFFITASFILSTNEYLYTITPVAVQLLNFFIIYHISIDSME